jgi:hypothetical protein
MSERDDDYLWSGSGEAPSDVARLEEVLAGEKLRAPLRARPRRPIRLALVAGLVAAAGVFAVMPADAIPPRWVAWMVAGVSSETEVLGGARVELSVTPGDGQTWERMVAERLDRMGADTVEVHGTRVIATLPAMDEADGRAWAEQAGRRGQLQLMVVAEDHPFSRELYRKVVEEAGGDEERANPEGITAEVDQWAHDPTGRHYRDYYLIGAERDQLERTLARVTPPPGHRFGLENTDRGWRSYLLRDEVRIDNHHVVAADVFMNEYTVRPEVLVTLSGDGEERFTRLTQEMIGRKIAILVDGYVQSAPVVQERIRGGRFSVSGLLGADSMAAAQALAGAFTSSPIDVGIEAVDVRQVAPTVSVAALEVVRGAIAGLFGLLLAGALWLVERRSRALDPEVSPVRGRARNRWLPVRRSLVTLGGGAAVVALAWVRLPGVDRETLEMMGMSIGAFDLGIAPALTAFVLVELAALLIPRLRRFRTGGPSGRAILGLATAALTIFLALFQSWMIWRWMASEPVLSEVTGPALIIVSTLTAGALVLALIALVIDRHGLGNGFAALIGAGLAVQAYRLGDALLTGVPAPQALAILGAIAATAMATAWILRTRVRGASVASGLRLPTAGIIPLLILPSVLALLAMTWPEWAGRIAFWWSETIHRSAAAEIAVVVLLGLGLSWLFSRPSRLGSAAASGRSMWLTFVRAAFLSTAYLVGLLLLQRWLGSTAPLVPLALSGVVIATAIAMDLIAELRALARRDDLQAIWPLHQVQRVELVTSALTRNDIDVHARGLHLRLLLHFVGPFVPVVLHVPAAQAEEARAIIRAQLGLSQPTPAEAPPDPAPAA